MNSNKLYSNSNLLNSNQPNSDLLNKCKSYTVSNSSILSCQSSSSIPSPTCLSNLQNPQVSLFWTLIINSMSENSSKPSYTKENPIVNVFKLRNCLSPTKLPTSTSVITPNIMPTFNGLDSNVRQLFDSKFLAALSNRDSILRAIRDCINSKDEKRCRTLSKQVHAQWKSLCTKNCCIFVDNRVAIPNSIMLHTPEVVGWLSWQIAFGGLSATYSTGFACVKRAKSLVRISNISFQQINFNL